MIEDSVVNAKIDNWYLFYEYGYLSLIVNFSLDEEVTKSFSCQNITQYAGVIIQRLMKVLNVDVSSDINGTYCRLLLAGDNGMGDGRVVKSIGSIVEDKWFNVDQVLEKEKSKTGNN